MPFKKRRKGRKSKFVTKRGLPFQLMKYAETKYLTFSDTDVVLANPASLFVNNINITNIREGTGLNERVGQMIQVTGFHIKIIFKAVNANDLRFLRVGVWLPRIPDDTTAPFTNMVIQNQFEEETMWFDKVVPCPTAGAGTPGGVMTIKKKFKPYLKVMFADDLGESQTKGTLRLIMLPKANASVEASWSVRTYFKDL